MKKVLFIATFPILLLGIGSYQNDFRIDKEKLLDQSTMNVLEKENSINLDSKSSEDKKLEDLTVLTTTLLFGNTNNQESELEYYNRYQDYLNLRYAPDIPKDDTTFSGYDESSQEYKDDIVSGITLPTIFKKIDEMKPVYHSYEDIQIHKTDSFVMSSITLPQVQYKIEDEDNREEYRLVSGTIVMHYFYKKQGNDYKLYYLYGEDTVDLSRYQSDALTIEEADNRFVVEAYYKSDDSIYQYRQIDEVSEDNISGIYHNNHSKVVYLKCKSGNSVVEANGFFIEKGLILTSNKFIRDSLQKGQFMIISREDNLYTFDGVVSSDEEHDIAIIKIKEEGPDAVTISNRSLEVENPVFLISSKSGIKNVIEKGIITSYDDSIQTSIPYTKNSIGGLLLDIDGNAVGLVSYNSQTNIMSILKPADLVKIKESISLKKSFSFDELKKNYYLTKNQESVVKGVPKRVWNWCRKIGDLENNIPLELVKSSYQSGIVSLRYHNSASSQIDSMVFVNGFTSQLKDSGYQTVLSSSEKQIYQNRKYKIIIEKDFDYLVIVVVKL